MPRENGKAVYDEIRQQRPDVNTLFMSGYTGDFLGNKSATAQNLNFILKPLRRSAILQKVREVLDQENAAAAA